MQNLNYLPLFINIILVAIFGLIFGSLASLISSRLVNKQAIVFARSKCLHCHNSLHPKNLIPLFSWLWQKGKCTFCHRDISFRYPLIESLFLLAFVATFWRNNWQINVSLLFACTIFLLLAIMVITDLEHYFIPDILPILLFVLALIIHWHNRNSLSNYFLSAGLYLLFGLAAWGFFYFTSGVDGLGIDDIKFFTVAGFLLGSKMIFLFFLLSGLFGVIFGVVWQKLKNDETFPFAPAICLSCYICLLRILF